MRAGMRCAQARVSMRVPADSLTASLGLAACRQAQRQRLEPEVAARAAAADASGSGGAAAGASTSSSGGSDGEWSGGEGEEGEENDDTYTDRRWRWLRLRPIGERWVQRVAGVTARARSGDLSRDVFVLDEGDGGHAAVHAKPAKASSQGL